MTRTPSGRGKKFGNSSGSAAILGLLVGTAVFVVAFIQVAAISNDRLAQAPQTAQDQDLEALAPRLLRQIIGSPGQGWYHEACQGRSPDPATFTPESVARFGLAREPCALLRADPGHNLSFEKIENIRRAQEASDGSNGRVDYEEARGSLGLEGSEFRLEAHVPLADARSAIEGGRQDPNLRALYIGDYVDGLPIPMPAATTEAAYLAALLSQFDPYAFDAAYDNPLLPHQPGGDVLPDHMDILVDELEPLLQDENGDPSLAQYNVLVLGSDVSNDACTPAQCKFTIQDWVEAGGLLIVLGSANDLTWLEPVFHVKLLGTTGTLHIDEPDHGLLTTPNDVDLASWSDANKGWRANGPGVGDFSTIAGRNDPTLAVSEEGAHEKGRLVLSSYRPFDPEGDGAPTGDCAPASLASSCAGIQLLQNLLSHAYADLDIEYGPRVPSDRGVGAATRLATVYHPEMEMSVELLVTAYVF